LLAAVAGLAGVPAPAARAQSSLPEAVVTSGDLSAENRATISSYVAGHLKNLAADNPEELRRARTALVTPLRNTGVSGSFRTVYSEALDKAGLPAMVADKRDEVAINALRVASELGTGKGLELLRAGLADPRQPVRAMAAMGYGRLMGTMRAGNKALLDSQIRDALRTIQGAMTAQQDPVVVDALVMSLADMMQIPANQELMTGLQNAAANVMLDAVAALAPKAPAELEPALTRATAAVITALTGTTTPLQNDTLKKAAGVAGDSLVFVLWRLESGELPQAERDRLAVLADQSARVIQLTSARVGGPKAPDTRLRDAVVAGEATRFKTEAAAYLNVLTDRSIGLPADRFKSRR
jgi:hypothetical protein